MLPDTRICDLRDEIESQLNDEGIIPNDFVFLKSVGSRVTRVILDLFLFEYIFRNYSVSGGWVGTTSVLCSPL